MTPQRSVAVLTALITSASVSSARASEFDAQGRLLFADGALVTESFEAFEHVSAGASSAVGLTSETALHGDYVLHATLSSGALPIPLTLPSTTGSYRLRYWTQGDCIGGLAVDYTDGRTATLAQAYPTGRMTSDGWVEMETAALPIDASSPGADIRLFLSPYDGGTTIAVDIDALEVVADGVYAEPASCVGVDLEGACGANQLCLAGTCHAAEGFFPPLPPSPVREQFVDYWHKKIRDTYGPYIPRRVSMPSALDALAPMRTATTSVAYWSHFAEAIRRLGDAHTYTRHFFQRQTNPGKPMNACFFEGDADLTHDVWPSDPAHNDILVSHTGPTHAWGLAQGDRLVAIDGVHPIAWASGLMSRSLWYWEADEPRQYANVVTALRRLIPLHATTITVVRCDAAAGTCAQTPELIEIASIPAPASGDEVNLVGCDNRPFYHLPNAPEDHNFGDALEDGSIVLEGLLAQSTPQENLRGLVWNDLLGGWPGSALDAKLNAAVDTWQTAGGVIEDHREGHGGTSTTANILVSFSRKPFVPLAGMMRDRATDEGPATPAEGAALFDKIRSYAGERAGSNDARTDIPVALLLTWDVSASDFLPFMMKGGPRVRLFGPGPTMGAFGTFYQYSFWGGMRWSVGAQDSITPEGLTLCGRGVYPDEIVMPRQSDLLDGKDTIHEAALAWLRAELAK